MPVELQEWLQSIDVFQLIVALGIIVYVFNLVFKKFLPSMAMMNKIVESVKDLPEDIPRLKKELEETKKKVDNIEMRLDKLVTDNLLPREGEINGDPIG